VAAQRRHLPEVTALREGGRLEAEARCEDAVARGRRAAALDVAEHRDARLEAGALRHLDRERLADAALRQDHVPELVDLAVVRDPRQLRTFADDDDREVLPARVPLAQT